MTALLKNHRFRYQNQPPPATRDATPTLTPAVFARLLEKCDRIATALDDIRAGLDAVAAALDPLPLGLVFHEPLRKCATPTPRPRRAVVAPAPSAPDPAQELLPLIFS